MSQPQPSVAKDDATPLPYAEMQQKMHQALISLNIYHQQLTASQATRSWQTQSNAILWNRRYEEASDLSFGHLLSTEEMCGIGRFGFMDPLIWADQTLSAVGRQCQIMEQKQLAYEMGLAAQQLQVARQLVIDITVMMQLLRNAEERYKKREFERERAQIDRDWQPGNQKEFVHAWMQNGAAMEEEGKNMGGDGIKSESVREMKAEETTSERRY
ncbi:hypothetical protein RhiJN_19699 [Ceratobasidium sp. AG-Ba]|nr:hypothetical protein RhiJN_04869 [Ceratobasidium sp. AG-Ba]QRV91681.1 hypothetical protein RhiJN_19699 [Ceratobasidium sp. AG-Ba]